MTQEIELSRGRVTLVDDADYPALARYHWYLWKRLTKGHMYAIRKPKRYTTVYMHRQLLDAPAGLEVDHINGDGLDNRRSNLRLCTRSQNARNWRIDTRDSLYKGVSKAKGDRLWKATIGANDPEQQIRTRTIGRYRTAERAARAYDAAALELYGDFAALNFPQEPTQPELLSQDDAFTLPARDNTSGTRNVYWHSPSCSWKVSFVRKGKLILCRYFQDKDEAVALAEDVRDAMRSI